MYTLDQLSILSISYSMARESINLARASLQSLLTQMGKFRSEAKIWVHEDEFYYVFGVLFNVQEIFELKVLILVTQL